jgi:hypothetical protein
VRHTETVCDTIDTLGVGSRASSVIWELPDMIWDEMGIERESVSCLKQDLQMSITSFFSFVWGWRIWVWTWT